MALVLALSLIVPRLTVADSPLRLQRSFCTSACTSILKTANEKNEEINQETCSSVITLQKGAGLEDANRFNLLDPILSLDLHTLIALFPEKYKEMLKN